DGFAEELRRLAHALTLDLVKLTRRTVDETVEVDDPQVGLRVLRLLERLPEQELPGDAEGEGLEVDELVGRLVLDCTRREPSGKPVRMRLAHAELVHDRLEDRLVGLDLERQVRHR